MLNTNIDYITLSDAMDHYTKLGYKQIEVPWYLPKQEMILAPEDNSFTLYSNKFLDMKCALVGSAEQSLVYMANHNYLVEDQPYMAVTPCFREDEPDNTHQSHFLKLELFQFSQKAISPHPMLEDITNFNKMYATNITTDYSQDRIIDVLINGIETNSINHDRKIEQFLPNGQIRKLNYLSGTGLALPRFSIARKI